MSYIYDSCKCDTCDNTFEYVWLYPDGKFEVTPDTTKYVFAKHNSVYTKYEVYAKCPNCKMISSFEYSKDGIFKGKL